MNENGRIVLCLIGRQEVSRKASMGIITAIGNDVSSIAFRIGTFTIWFQCTLI